MNFVQKKSNSVWVFKKKENFFTNTNFDLINEQKTDR